MVFFTHSDRRTSQADALRALTISGRLNTTMKRTSCDKAPTCCFKSDLAISSINIWPKGPRSWCLRGIFASLIKGKQVNIVSGKNYRSFPKPDFDKTKEEEGEGERGTDLTLCAQRRGDPALHHRLDSGAAAGKPAPEGQAG